MKYKNQLINVIKNTFILGINDRLLPNTYDTNLYPEDKNFKDIDNSQQRNINSDIIFDDSLELASNNLKEVVPTAIIFLPFFLLAFINSFVSLLIKPVS